MKPTVQKEASRTRLPLTDIQTLRKRARRHIEEEHAEDLSSLLEGLAS